MPKLRDGVSREGSDYVRQAKTNASSNAPPHPTANILSEADHPGNVYRMARLSAVILPLRFLGSLTAWQLQICQFTCLCSHRAAGFDVLDFGNFTPGSTYHSTGLGHEHQPIVSRADVALNKHWHPAEPRDVYHLGHYRVFLPQPALTNAS
jgi:hypothetical protein